MLRTMMFITIVTLLTTQIAKSDNSVDKVVNGMKEVPTKVNNFVKSEWEETKEFQKKGWADAKKQTAQTWNKIKSAFGVKND